MVDDVDERAHQPVAVEIELVQPPCRRRDCRRGESEFGQRQLAQSQSGSTVQKRSNMQLKSDCDGGCCCCCIAASEHHRSFISLLAVPVANCVPTVRQRSVACQS